MRFRFAGFLIDVERKGLSIIVVLVTALFLLIVYTSYDGRRINEESVKKYESLDFLDDFNKRESPYRREGSYKELKKLGDVPIKRTELVPDDDDDDDDGGGGGGVNVRDGLKGKRKKKYLQVTNVKSVMDTIPKSLKDAMARTSVALKMPHRPPDNHYGINVTFSDLTSLDRDLPDTRPTICSTFNYDLKTLPKVSIIIPFFNEAPTMLLRNIHSILNRSPNDMLEEIILVDDMSSDVPLQKPLDDFIKHIPRTKLLRNLQRMGLIVSRMRGAREAKGQALIFLDAHSEVNVGWLEPLLEELRKNPNQVLQPFIDGIDNRNLDYSIPNYYFKGTFSWDLRYTWTKITDHEEKMAKDTGLPFFTPTLVGCAIAVMKKYFFDIGSFDEGMYVWGGENIELAFRTWMCGGKAVTVTCSRVGHVFKQSPNKFDGTKGSREETVQKNLIRVADVWMDGMRKFFYGTTLMFDFKKIKLSKEDLVTLEERTELRKRLKCHNFEWYLYNVVPEMLYLPPMDSIFFGEIMNLKSRACWEVTEDYYITLTYFCFEHKIIPKNNFAIMKNGLMTYRDKCIKINPPSPFLILDECPPPEQAEKFGIFELTTPPGGILWGGIKVKRLNDEGVYTNWCIVQVTNAMPQHHGQQMPQLGSCDAHDSFQAWSFTYAVNFTLVPEYMDVYKKKLS